MSRLLKKILILISSGFLFGALCVLAILWVFSNNLPDYKFLKNYKPAVSSKVYSGNGELVSDFSSEKRIFIPFEAIPKKIMERYGAYKNGFLDESCGLRFEYLYNNDLEEKSYQGNILLAPEGVFQVKEMMNYVIKQLMLHTKYHLTIRMHPVLPINSIKHDLDYNIDTIQNITISRNKSLLDDLKMADIVIYRGSTVCLEALYMGIPIIHFDDGSFLSEDPLFLSNSLKWIVTKNDKLTNVIESICDLDNSSKIKQMEKVRVFISNYFHPITEKNLQKFLYN